MTKIAVFMNTFLSAIILIGPSFLGVSNAFTISPVTLKTNHVTYRGIASSSPRSRTRSSHGIHNFERPTSSSSTTSLSMYNLPPGGGGGGGGGKNDIAEIAKGALSIALIIGFFVSPLGGLVLGLFNSFLVLLFLLPVVGGVGFQLWQKFNTVQAPCPNCGAQAVVMKNKGGDTLVDSAPAPQSICFSCGAILEPNADNTGINNVTGRKTIDDLNSPMGQQASLFDLFTTGAPGGGDSFSTTTPGTTVETSTPSSKKKSNTGGIDKNAVIDVDVLDEDKPFQ